MTRFSLQGDASWMRQKWQDTIDLYRECLKDERKGAERFASKVGAIIEEVEEMLSEQPKGNDNSVTIPKSTQVEVQESCLRRQCWVGCCQQINKLANKRTKIILK